MLRIGTGIFTPLIVSIIFLFVRAEKNLSNAMKSRVTEKLQDLQIVNGNVTVTFTEIEKVEGDMTAMNRKGKTYACLYFLLLGYLSH